MLLLPSLAPCHTAIVKVPVTQALRFDHDRDGKMIITVTVTSATHASDRACSDWPVTVAARNFVLGCSA